jgi:hypothetical protein
MFQIFGIVHLWSALQKLIVDVMLSIPFEIIQKIYFFFLKHAVVRPLFQYLFPLFYSEWDERGEGQIANTSSEDQQLTVCTTTTRRFLCDVHRPIGRGDSSSAGAAADGGGDGGDLNASPPAEGDKLSGEEGGRRDLGAISKTGKR